MSGTPMVYETQFFGFTPQTCMLRMYIAFQDHLFNMMVVVEEVILKKLENFRHTNLTPSLIRRGTEKFLSSMKRYFNQYFGKMEQMLLQMVLSIPKNVLLPEDKVQERFCYTAEQFQELQDSINHLEQQVKAETFAQQALEAELEEQKAVQVHLEQILQWFDNLDGVCREHGARNLKESFAFLKTTSCELQNVVQGIDKKRAAAGLSISRKPEQGKTVIPQLDE